MKMNEFSVLTVLVITLSIISVNGHPSPQTKEVSDLVEPTTPKSGIRGWIKNVQNKFREHGHDCNHSQSAHGGGVFNWVKNKLGFTKTSTVAPTTTITETNNNDNRQPDIVDNNREENINSDANRKPTTESYDESSNEEQSPVGTENKIPENNNGYSVTENQNEFSGEDLSQPTIENERPNTENDDGFPSGEDLSSSNAEEVTIRSSMDPSIDVRTQL